MINSKTKIYGIIGHPIEHSLSPIMHNAVFKEKNINAIYLAFNVKNLENAIKGAKSLNFSGLNVTIPYKIDVIKFLDEISEEAKLINAVNTIKFENDKISGYNTDGIGAIRAIEEKIKVKGKKIFIFGAGGAARAIIFQAILNGAEIYITNRTIEKAKILSEEVFKKLNKKIEVVKFENNKNNNIKNIKEILKECDIIINTTSVGMFPNVYDSIIDEDIIPENKIAMDIVYNPLQTKFLKFANNKGCEIITGEKMLIYQGAEALKIWLNLDPSEIVEIMEKAIKCVLK